MDKRPPHRPRLWDKALGETRQLSFWVPQAVRELLKETMAKLTLQEMARNDDFKREVYHLADVHGVKEPE